MNRYLNMFTIEDFPPHPNVVPCGAAVEYISRWKPEGEPNIPDIFYAEKMRNLKDIDDVKQIRNVLQEFVSRAQELTAYFKVPNQQMMSNITPPPSIFTPNQIVASFINFLLLMVEAITYREGTCTSTRTCSIENLRVELKFLIQNLQRELGFLITFLGDTAMHPQHIRTNKIITDIEAVVNQVGRFIFSYLFTFCLHMAIISDDDDHNFLYNFLYKVVKIEAMHNEVGKFLRSILKKSFEVEENDNSITEIKDLVHKVQSFTGFFVAAENDRVLETGILLDLSLSNLLQNFELLNTKIKEHCVLISKMPSDHMAPITTVVSLFIVDSVLDDLMYLINNKSDMNDGVDDQIVRLYEELMLLGSSINEITEHQQQTEHEELIMRTRDIAYEVDSVINSLPPAWYLSLRLPQFIHNIQIIMVDIKKINKHNDTTGEKQVTNYREKQALLSSKQTPVFEDNTIGFKQVEREIMEQLIGGTLHRQIISISGMPGLGKTTFANKLYNHPSIVKHFDCRAWCVSSQTCNKKNMLINILMSFNNLKRENITEDEDLGGKVYRIIKKRRYLLVIDDIWDIKAWNDLKRYFPDDGNGSRILFTTRNKEVGSEASASVMKELPFLSDAQCWELIRRKVYQGENCPQELLDIGKKIADKCRGLPLAAVIIAGVLANMEKNECLWQEVESNISSHIVDGHNNYMQLLELSYKHLPLNLKPCFLYFAAFDEDSEIPVKMLTSIWIAERFVKKEEGKNLEDVAREYLIKLIDRSLVLISKRGSKGQVKTCKIHDLLLDMCSRIAGENFFLKKVEFNDHDQVLYQKHRGVRVVSHYGNKSPNYMPPFGLGMRSLQCVGAGKAMLFSCSFKALKVFHHDSKVIGIGHLVQLRYLATKFGRHQLPIQKLQRLEFLEVNSLDVEITEDILNMVNLRHMNFRGDAYFSESCRLRATNEESFQINNKVLQSITGIKISDEIDEKILRCFHNLRRLRAELQASFNCSFDFLDQLESLTLETESFSSLISLPSNLKRLALTGILVSSEQMEIIERLEHLEVLKLKIGKFEGAQWDTTKYVFPQLKYFKLATLHLSEWNASSDTFPSLERLVLRHCLQLEAIPCSFGDISTLQKIELIGCPESVKESAKEIETYQKEMGNEDFQVIESG